MILNLRNLWEDEWGEKTHKGHHLHNPSLNSTEIASTQGLHTWKIAPYQTIAHSTEISHQKARSCLYAKIYCSNWHMAGIP